MKTSFRIGCPFCLWGYRWSNNFINQGWIKLTCKRCGTPFFTKVVLTGVSVNTSAFEPKDVPIKNMGL